MVIYFIQAEGIGHIKIGFTDGYDVQDRIKQLQTGSPARLVLLGTMPGTVETEKDFHRQFAHSHSHGEWFRASPDLLEFIGTSQSDNREGPAEITNRFVQLKILTVGRKSMTKNIIKQFSCEHVLDLKKVISDLSERAIGDLDPNVYLVGVPWGWYRDDGKNYLIWQKNGTLRRILLHSDTFIPSGIFSCHQRLNEDGREFVIDVFRLEEAEHIWCGKRKFYGFWKLCCELWMASYDQLFIGS